MVSRIQHVLQCLRSFRHPSDAAPVPRRTKSAPLRRYKVKPFVRQQCRGEEPGGKQPHRREVADYPVVELHPETGTLQGLGESGIVPQAQSAAERLNLRISKGIKLPVGRTYGTPATSHNRIRAVRSRRGSRHPYAHLTWKLPGPETTLIARNLKPWSKQQMDAIIDRQKKLPKLLPKDLKVYSLMPWKSMRRSEGIPLRVDSLSKSWFRRFAIISKGSKNIIFCGYRPEHILRLLSLHNNRNSIIKAWMMFQRPNREIHWHGMMLWALQNSPRRALKLLDASVTTPALRPSRHIVEDCITYLCHFYLAGGKQPDPLKIDTLLRIICNFAEVTVPIPGHDFTLNQHAVFWLLTHCDDHQVEILFETLRRQNMKIHMNTLLHFLERFINMGRISLPLEILRSLVISGCDVSTSNVQSGCVHLLRGSFPVQHRYNIQSSILTQMLEIGIRPKIHMYNVIILNAIEAADYQTAWDMYKVARENGLEPDAFTYSIMMKGAKQNLDTELVEHIIRDAEEDGNLPRDERLVRDVLDALFASELVKSQMSVFKALLPIYTRYCDIGPLRDLGLVLDSVDTPSGLKHEVQPPSSWTVGLMIIAYTKQYQDSDLLIHRYMRYHTLLEENHPIIAPTAQLDYISNAFIMALGRSRQSLESCVLVIKHMLEPLKEVNGVKPAIKAIPTVQTWTILAQAYLRHGQKLAAEKVIKMMEARGMAPNDITWNIIIRGYSQLQDIDNAVEAVKGMETAGFEVNAYTMKALGWVKDRALMLEALKKAIRTGSENEYHENNFKDDSTAVAYAPDRQKN